MKTIQTALLVSTLALVLGCSPSTDLSNEEPVLRPVRTQVVAPADSAPYKDFSAVVDASQKVNLAFKVSGRIVEMGATLGEPINKGDLIASLDDTDIKLEVEQAQSSFDKAKSDYNRGKELIKNNTISQADFDTLKSQYTSSLVQLETAQNRLAYTRLEATFDGVIAQKMVENFEEVSAGQAIVALHNINTINLKVDVPESVIIGVKPGEPAPTFKASFTAIEGVEFDVNFKEISTQADDVTKTYQVVFTMPSPTTNTILPGMSARVRATLPPSRGTLASYYLPAQSVLKDNKGNYVYVVKANGDGSGTIERKEVTVGDITVYGMEVFSGVVEGEHVVTAGMSKVTAGQQVKFKA